MLQLIYASTVTPGEPGNDLTTLCRQASRNNRRDEITGVLLLKQDHYLQVLEGPKDMVEDTFLRIINDPRHHSLLLLSRSQVTVRAFGNFAMAHYDSANDQSAIIDRVDGMIAGAPAHVRQRFEDAFAH